MNPDFSKSTIDTLAKRAAFKCSNPDCRVSTIGPNKDANKSTLIGEAAHIHGARVGSKRYVESMSDAARSEITNALWLCRNCHKMIDSDERRYTANILFAWRTTHEEYVLAELGNFSDRLILEDSLSKIESFKNYPPIIKRIVIDEPPAWEWRLASELLTYLNKPLHRKLENLNQQLYTKPLKQINLEDFISWVSLKLAEMQQLMPPFEGLLDRLTLSFGAPGEKGDLDEIHHICILISDYIKQVILMEESLYFVHVPDECLDLVNLLRNGVGSQAMKLADIPLMLNKVAEKAVSEEYQNLSEPEVVCHTIELVLPDNWSKDVSYELEKIHRLLDE
ncbi:hypothetical protein [Shewanella sp. Isolate8]|uniref:hypothetical protein n=1 Tax=Shewanella sp. Isolate8 TaxID=2908529 RepID=UPI001EFDC254|nr:hypothetical protein [Shewanella sp. Isolate8]MCG9745808.1 hypothetical protein [Shewanella sp. Isolate8]